MSTGQGDDGSDRDAPLPPGPLPLRGSNAPTPPGVVRVRAQGAPRREAPTTAGPDVRTSRVALSRERIAGALRSVESKREAPHLHLGATIDLGPCVALLGERSASAVPGDGIEVEDVLLAACAGALASCPALNGRFAGDAIETWEEIHLAFSVAVGQSLAWPVLRSPGRLPIDALSALRRELARRVRAGEAKADDEKGSTFSVALLGELGIESAYEVIRPPQAAILAIGTPVRRAVVRGHGIEVDWVVSLGLSCDRRIVEEPAAARFLAELGRRVEQPMLLLGD